MISVVLLTLGAGLAMPLGAIVARVERIGPSWLEDEFRHSVIAFGGGALLSAVALVLVPEGSWTLPGAAVVICFALGGIAFMGLDVFLASRKGTGSQLVAMLADFVPEALALGSTLSTGSASGPLLAGLIALQNLPEGFNAYREHQSRERAFRPARVVAAFGLMALLGPAAGVAGYLWLAASPAATGAIMLFAAGGILYLIFQDIAPQAKLERHWGPPLGAVAGFLGLIGYLMTMS